MIAGLKYCGMGIKLSSTLLLAADAVSSSTPVAGLLLSLLTLVPFAWGFQTQFAEVESAPEADFISGLARSRA